MSSMAMVNSTKQPYLKHVRSSSLPSALAGGEDPVKISYTLEHLKILKILNWILGLRPRMTSSLTIFLIVLLAASSQAIKIDHLSYRSALTADYSTSFYLEIENDSNQLDYLLEVKIIDQPNLLIQIRKTVIEKNIARIIKIDRLIVPAHSTVSLSPLGIYIVATGPLFFQENPLKLEFIFENAGKVVVNTKEIR